MTKHCLRCSREGHLSHTCRAPNPLDYPVLTAQEKRICGTCRYAQVALDDEPCDTCDRTNGRFSNWIAKEPA